MQARTARITGGARTRKEVDAYLPDNYATVVVNSEPSEHAVAYSDTLVEEDNGHIVRVAIVGVDVAGWTLDGYVIPRLASGLIFAEEVTS